jgi:CRISPR-associated protein Cas2
VTAGLETIIDSRADDVRIYPLPTRLEAHLLGRQLFPDDVLLLDGGINLIIR